jgi:hypothetical protein
MSDVTDYTPGDDPVPIGTMVRYEGADYEIEQHQNPQDHPVPPPSPPAPTLDEAYPDGVAYYLWPIGRRKSMDNGQFMRHFVRRTSFCVIDTEPTFKETPH